MAVVITSTVTTAYDWNAGETVTPAKLDSTATPTAATTITTGANTVLGSVAGGAVAEISCTSAGRALLDDAAASDQRTTLGLGTMATQAASAVAITGGTITGITDLAVADGGTGASTANLARTNLNQGTVALTPAATIATNCALGNVFTVTLDQASTLGAPTNMVAGATYIWVITQDASPRTLAFNSAFKFQGGIDPTISTGSGAIDVITGIATASNAICCGIGYSFS